MSIAPPPLAAATAPPAGRPAPATLLRSALRRHAAGVTIITVPGPAGFTASSFTSVSLEPALVTFFVGVSASSAPFVRCATHFGVHLLDAEHAPLARQFAGSGGRRFDGVGWRPSSEGVPLLDGTAWLTARIIECRRLGDHYQVVGELADAATRPGCSPLPLLHHDGAYATIASLDRTG
jgi:flavin reductase (DIM6/NTAB) family NADH-FMN oxidoreductase RutF